MGTLDRGLPFAMLLAALSLVLVAAGVYTFRGSFPSTAYRFVLVSSTPPSLATQYGAVDIDGDGTDEILQRSRDFVALFSVDHTQIEYFWQINSQSLGRGWKPFGPKTYPMTCQAADIDKDGKKEILILGILDGGVVVHIFDYEARPVTSIRASDVEDVDGAGGWDGSALLWALLDANSDGRLDLVVRLNASYDRRPRGLVVYDWRKGTRVWSYLTGPGVICPNVVDLTGDPGPEIAFSSVANRNGNRCNGTDDGRAYLFLLSSDGRLISREELGFGFSESYVLVADFDGDGEPQLATYVWGWDRNVDQKDELRLWRWSEGALTEIAQLQIPGPSARMVLYRRREGELPTILLPTRGNILEQISVQNGKPRVDNERAFAGQVEPLWTADLLGDSDQEIVVRAYRRELLVLDSKLHLLARLTPSDFPMIEAEAWSDASAFPLRTKGRPTEVALSAGRLLIFSVERVWPVAGRVLAGVGIWLLGLASGLLSLSLVWPQSRLGGFVRHRLGADLSRGGGDVKGHRLELLRLLRHSTHGSQEPVDRLAALVQLLYAVSSETEPTENQLEQARVAVADYREVRLPMMTMISELAWRCRVDPGWARTLDSVTGSIRKGVNAIALVPGDLQKLRIVAGELDADRARAAAALREVREDLLVGFAVNVEEQLHSAVELYRAAIEEHEMELEFDIEGEGRPYIAFGSPEGLSFVFGNLIDNAVWAMKQSQSRRLKIRCWGDRNKIFVGFSDTGCGIDEQDKIKIFGRGYSRRGGTGIGLSQSRQILEDFDGEIWLARSKRGEGSEFMVRLFRTKVVRK